MNDDARVILALAAEADDEFIWNDLRVIQADMFAAGPVSIKFAYYGAEDRRQIRPFITTQWIVDPDDMAEVMERGRAHCVCGCFINVGDILAAALKENQDGPVQAVIIIGDHFHGDLNAAIARAKELCATGTRLFLFQQGHSNETEGAFRTLAEHTGGAYFKFQPTIERIAEKLPGLLQSVTHFAIGGMHALAEVNNASANLLIEQMSDESLFDSADLSIRDFRR
jgi:hypothetical protein